MTRKNKALEENVNRWTRAGKNGKYVYCPHCEAIPTDVDFETTQITCWDCKKEVKLI